MRCTSVILCLLLASLSPSVLWAEGVTSFTFSIPSDDGFDADYEAHSDSAVLHMRVGADPGCRIWNSRVTGNGWVAFGNLTAFLRASLTGAGHHVGHFTGNYSCSQGGSGEPPTWSGIAKVDVYSTSHRTVRPAPSGTPNTRQTIGVAEEVEFTLEGPSGGAVQWSVEPAVGTLTGANAPVCVWQAPPEGGSATVRCYVDGCLISETGFTIIEPVFTGRRDQLEWIERNPGGDVGVRGTLWVRTTASHVNFTYVGWLEDDAPFAPDAGANNFLTGMAGVGHSPGTTPVPFVIRDGSNMFDTFVNDTIAWAFDSTLVTWPSDGTQGSGIWNIPTHWTFNAAPYGNQMVPMRAAIEFKLGLGFPTINKYGVVFP